MATNNNTGWVWSKQHHDSYFASQDAQGNTIYTWASEVNSAQGQSNAQQQTANHGQVGAGQSDYRAHRGHSGGVDSGASLDRDPNMPEPVSPDVRRHIPDLMSGNPQKGWHDLDPSYQMRTGTEAREFFVKGRVFSMLWAETASETYVKNGTENTAITYDKFGVGIYSQIRRFVVVGIERGFVYAMNFTTALQGEKEAGLKHPIEIIPAGPDIKISGPSRIRYGKTYPVEMNVKVKDIGKVVHKHQSRLLRYWRQHNTHTADDPDDGDHPEDPASPESYKAMPTPTPTDYSYNQPQASHNDAIPRNPGLQGYGSHAYGPQSQDTPQHYSQPRTMLQRGQGPTGGFQHPQQSPSQWQPGYSSPPPQTYGYPQVNPYANPSPGQWPSQNPHNSYDPYNNYKG